MCNDQNCAAFHLLRCRRRWRPAAASAQDFPSKPIRLIVPFPPGGPNDLIARVVGQKMSEILKQQVVIDNRGGAGGALGTDVVAKAAPDGHTIAITTAGALAISMALQEKLPYDTLKHLKPVTLVARCRSCWWRRPAFPPTISTS